MKALEMIKENVELLYNMLRRSPEGNEDAKNQSSRYAW